MHLSLHKSPGPHLADMRMNWVYMRIWRWLADATVYLLLFVSASGIYLWHVIRAERRAGLVLLAAGAISFFASSMPSPTELEVPVEQGRPRGTRNTLALWNRRLHYYAGLYFLCFIWLFALTGLLLNHPKWTFAEFWPNRRQATQEREITAPAPGSDLAQARELMRQLAIQGEIEWTMTRSDPGRFDFRVTRPGHNLEVKADLTKNRATVQRTDLNLWGVTHVLHVFTGVRMGDKANSRDWILTTIWALAMDALAAGLIFMVLSSLYMWYELPQKRRLGIFILSLGILGCGLFCVGLRWLY